MEIAADPDLLAAALAKFDKYIYAPSTRDPRDAKVNTWSDVSRPLGHDPCHPDRPQVRGVMAVLKGAGFASAGDYLDVMKTEFVGIGGQVSDSLNSYARKAKRSTLRGLGPAAKASAPTFELLANLPDDPNP